MTEVPKPLVWALFVAIVILRTVWWSVFLYLSCRSKSTKGVVGRLRDSYGISTLERATRFAQEELKEEDLQRQHDRRLHAFEAQRSDAFTLGSIALAAWGVLLALSPDVPEETLQLLLLGVIANIAGPSIFRRGGIEGTYMGIETSTAIGNGAIVLSLTLLIPTVFGGGLMSILGLLLGSVLVIREGLEVATEIRLTYRLFASAPRFEGQG